LTGILKGLRRRVNDSPAIKLTIPTESYRGSKRNQLFFLPGKSTPNEMPLDQALAFMAKDNPQKYTREQARIIFAIE
jgi:hypothetical protein